MAVYKEYAHSNGVVVKAPYYDIACKYCGSKNVIRYGHFRGIQRFWCNDCQRKSADNDTLPNMQTPHIPDVLDLPRYTKTGFKIVRRKPKRAKKQGRKPMASIATIVR
jgi:hypothetical protein